MARWYYLHAEIQEYRIKVHLFEAVSSPSCCNHVLRKTANDNESDYPIAAETIRRNFYVDDCLRSDKTEETTTKLIQNLQMVYAKGGFRLTKFVCNNRAVLESIPVGERTKETRTLDLHRNLYCPSNVLMVSSGVWNQMSLNSVSFLTTNRQQEEEYYSSVYDPLGFAAPFILPAKKILQDLCREDIGRNSSFSANSHFLRCKPYRLWSSSVPQWAKLVWLLLKRLPYHAWSLPKQQCQFVSDSC